MIFNQYLHLPTNKILSYGINFHYIGAEPGEEYCLVEQTACGLLITAKLSECEPIITPQVISQKVVQEVIDWVTKNK